MIGTLLAPPLPRPDAFTLPNASQSTLVSPGFLFQFEKRRILCVRAIDPSHPAPDHFRVHVHAGHEDTPNRAPVIFSREAQKREQEKRARSDNKADRFLHLVSFCGVWTKFPWPSRLVPGPKGVSPCYGALSE